jgi:hypothetical protein
MILPIGGKRAAFSLVRHPGLDPGSTFSRLGVKDPFFLRASASLREQIIFLHTPIWLSRSTPWLSKES